MNRRGILCVALIAGALAWANPASSFSFRTTQYPNGPARSCDGCHISPGGPRNAFGLQVFQTKQGANVNWPALFDLDADGDGFTNGEELNDAYGAWRQGNAHPGELSDPAEAGSVPNQVGSPPEAVDVTVESDEDTTYTGELAVIDADGDTLRYRLVQRPQLGTLTLNANTGEYVYTPAANVYGTDSFVFQVWDGRNILGTREDGIFTAQPATVTIEVLPVNDPPTITTQGDRTTNEDQAVSFTASATDVEDGALAVNIPNLPEGATFNAQTGVFSWTPNYFQAGQYALQVQATDNEGLTQTQTVTITVNNVNRPPQIDGLDGTPAGIEGDTLTFSAVASDLDLEDLTYTWDFGTGEALEGATVSYEWPQDGAFEVVLTVSDGFDEATQSYTVVVQNVAPTVEAGPDVALDEGEAYALMGGFVDPGRLDEHTYLWTFGDGETSAALEDSYAWGDDGTFTVTLAVSDDDATGRDTFVAVVSNVAPVADAGGARTIDEGEAYTFEGEYVDPGFLDAHTHAWDFGNGRSANTQDATYTYGDQGSFTVSYTVADDDGGQDTDTATVTVLNVAPTVRSTPPRFAPLNQTLRYQVEGYDPGNDTIRYTLVLGPPEMEISDAGLITYFPNPDDEEETFQVSVRVYDEDGGEYFHNFSILVGLPDADLDGAIDECELQYNFDPNDPADGPQDADGDGYTNAEECQLEENPLVSNSPQAPSVNEPVDGAVVSRLPPISLYVNNAVDPDNVEEPGSQVITYIFEIYGDAQLTVALRTWEGVAQGQNRTGVAIDFPVVENTRYYWRARAYDGRGLSPWTNVSDFVYSLVNDPPTVPTPVEPQGRVLNNPVFSMQAAQDPEGDIISYEIQVFDGEGAFFDGAFGLLDLGQPRVTWSSARPFVENQSYSWRGRATNGSLIASEWSAPLEFVYNAVNAPPTRPMIVGPAEGVTINEAGALRFEAMGSEDEDGDQVSYTFRIATDAGFGPGSVVVEQAGIFPDANGVARWDAAGRAGQLQENTSYYWDVRGRDLEGHGEGASSRFLLSLVNDAPGKITIQAPAQGESLRVQAPVFSWINVSDPEGQAVSYAVAVYRDQALTEVAWQRSEIPAMGAPGELTQVMGEALEDNQTYWWRVRGVDAGLALGEWSDAARFTVAVGGEPPTKPILAGPANESMFGKGAPITLLWRHSTDPEGDPITYRVEILNASGSVVTRKEGLTPADGDTNSYTLEVALIEGRYNWRVQASALGQDSPWSNSVIFSVTAAPIQEEEEEEEEEPAPPATTSAGDGGGCAQAPGAANVSPWALLLLGALLLRRRRA
jgi:VCBS repeat-containing protein